jgi:hypothetical protein
MFQTCTNDGKASVSEDSLPTRVLLGNWNLNCINMTVHKLSPRFPLLSLTRTVSIYCHSDKSSIPTYTNYSGWMSKISSTSPEQLNERESDMDRSKHQAASSSNEGPFSGDHFAANRCALLTRTIPSLWRHCLVCPLRPGCWSVFRVMIGPRECDLSNNSTRVLG